VVARCPDVSIWAEVTLAGADLAQKRRRQSVPGAEPLAFATRERSHHRDRQKHIPIAGPVGGTNAPINCAGTVLSQGRQPATDRIPSAGADQSPRCRIAISGVAEHFGWSG